MNDFVMGKGILNREVYEKLKRLAKAQQRITYLQLNKECNLGLDFQGENSSRDINVIADILDTISTREVRAGRPMLSAVVVRNDTKRPGNGFYECARKLNLWKKGNSREIMYAKQLGECYSYWGKQK